MAQGNVVNVTELIDQGRFGRFQLWVAIWCGALVMIDGFDIGTTAYVVPVMAPLWQLTPAAFAPVFLSTLIGVLIGTLSSGPIADRFGRKCVVIAAALTFGSFEIATIFVEAIGPFITLRFLTGLGIGALMPISVALTAEYAPQRIRTTVTAIMYLGFPMGVGVGGFIAAEIIPTYGWQSMFVIGGVLPIILLAGAIFALPESIRFLVVRGDQNARVAHLLNRLTGDARFTSDDRFMIAEEKTKGFPVKHLFTEGRAVTTSLLWVVFFCNLLVIYFLNAWLPTVLRGSGVPLNDAFRLTGALSWGGIIGILILGPIVDRLGATRVVTCLFLFATMFVIAIGFAGNSIPRLAISIVGCGGCITAGQSFSNVLAAALYPTTARSTGIAWALGIGRAGTLLGPVVGAALLSANVSAQGIFFSAGVPALIAAGAMLLLGRRLRAAKAALAIAEAPST